MTRSQKFNSASLDPSPASRFNDGITVEQVSVLPSAGSARTRPLLQDVSFRLAPNSVTLIAGHTGSGKSTLLHALAGLLPIEQGRIAYGDQELRPPNQQVNPAVFKAIGLVFQYPERQLFAESIDKELRYSLRPYLLSRAEQQERIRHALRRMGLPDAFLKESFLTLSDGQKRKAAIASTIVTEPQWLLLDEPTAGIDPQGIGPLLRLLEEHKQTPGGGVIVVSHDLDTFLPLADRVLLLQDGRLAADGTPEALLSKPEVWLNTGVGLPSALALALTLEKQGLALRFGRRTTEETGSGSAERVMADEGEERSDCRFIDEIQTNGYAGRVTDELQSDRKAGYTGFPLEAEAMAEAILQELRSQGRLPQQRKIDSEQTYGLTWEKALGSDGPLPEPAASSGGAGDPLLAAGSEVPACAVPVGSLPPLAEQTGHGIGENKSSGRAAPPGRITCSAEAAALLGQLPAAEERGGFVGAATPHRAAASPIEDGEASLPLRDTPSAASRIVNRLHPIAKWLVYMLLSAGILLQHSWSGLAAAALITVLCILISGSPYRSLWKPAKPFIYFIVISTLISGCGVSWEMGSWKPERFYFTAGPALQTLQLLFRFLLVMLLGVLLAVTTGTKMMQAGLEQAFAQLERLRIPVAAFTFFATLLVRFLPMLLQELDRTALIVQARGKTTGKRGLLRLREVPVFLIPFLLSMMKHAEDLSLALEARGYQLKRLRGEGRTRLRWTGREWLAGAAGIALFGVLYWTGR